MDGLFNTIMKLTDKCIKVEFIPVADRLTTIIRLSDLRPTLKSQSQRWEQMEITNDMYNETRLVHSIEKLSQRF